MRELIRTRNLLRLTGGGRDEIGGVDCSGDEYIAPLPPAPSRSSSSSAGPAPIVSNEQRDLEATFDWQGFLFTRTKDKGDWIGYQATCYNHDPSGHDCRLSRSFRPHGGRDRTRLMLKSWCLRAADPTITTPQQHKAEPNDPFSPTARELDEAFLPPLPAPSGRHQSGSKCRSLQSSHKTALLFNIRQIDTTLSIVSSMLGIDIRQCYSST